MTTSISTLNAKACDGIESVYCLNVLSRISFETGKGHLIYAYTPFTINFGSVRMLTFARNHVGISIKTRTDQSS